MKVLKVPMKQQPAQSKWCWATCAVMLSEYFNGPGLTCEKVLEHFGLQGMQAAGCSGMVAQFLEAEFRLSYEAVRPEEFCDYLDRSVPLILGFHGQSGGHAVLLTGYVKAANGTVTYCFNDPAEATRVPISALQLAHYDGMKFHDAFAIGTNRFD